MPKTEFSGATKNQFLEVRYLPHVRMGEDKKVKRKSEVLEEGNNKESLWEEKVSRVGPISKPLASRKLAKKIYKVVKKGNKCASDNTVYSAHYRLLAAVCLPFIY